jgi:hypothetical protein
LARRSLVLANDFRAIGTLGPAMAADVAKLASMIGSMRATLIALARGRYRHLDNAGRIDLLERELGLWRDIEVFGSRSLSAFRAWRRVETELRRLNSAGVTRILSTSEQL